jgi:hypothetical protein
MRALILAASMLLGAFAGSSTPASSAPPPAAASAPAPELIKLAAEVRKTGPRLARLWPGYWPPDQAFVIYRPGEGALLVAAEAPPSYAPLPAAGLPRPLRRRAWFRPGHLEGVNRPFILGYPIGGGRTAVLVLAGEGTKDLATLIFHEQFHDYQVKAFKLRHNSQFVGPKAVPDRVGFAAAAETERRVLAAALAAGPGRARDGLLLQYLALRREREKSLPPEVLKVERQFEKVEGTARFVDRAAVALAPGADETLPALLAEALGSKLGGKSDPFLQAWFRSRSYGIGAALTYFLRELDPTNWQSAAEGTGALDERLAELTGFEKVRDPASLAQSARSAFGHDRTKAALEPGIRAAEREEIKSAEEFYALGVHRLQFEVRMPSGSGASDIGMGFATGSGGMTFLAERHLVLPDPEVVDVTLPFAALTVRGRPFMSQSGEMNLYTILLEARPSVNGAALAAGEHAFEKLDLTAEGLKLSVERPVSVVVRQRETIVRLR